jgi:ribonucleoside-triphosphate reductase
MQVIKRDDTVQEFSFDKVERVLKRAFKSVNQEVPEKFIEQLKDVLDKFALKNDSIKVEEIQDIIQKELIKRNKFEVVESFINYRRKHAEIRENKSELVKQIRSKLNASDVQNQNANLDEASFGGRVGEAASVACKHEALKMMNPKSRKNHEENIVYVHDLDSYVDGRHNCLTYPIDKTLATGFSTRQADVRQPGSVNTALQLTAVQMQCQSLEQFGGISVSHLDWSMVPYIRKSFAKHYIDGLKYLEGMTKEAAKELLNLPECKTLPNDDSINYLDEMLKMTESIDDDRFTSNSKVYNYALDMTKREVYQAAEGMFHNLNTLN